MHFINNIIEPKKLLLAWQSLDEEYRTRYIVAELNSTKGMVTLNYLVNTKDFLAAQQRGFESYPAFQDINKIYSNVLDTFIRRLPPRSRGDFPQYLEGIRVKPDAKISDFALLGYSGAKLLSDGFSLIHPFNDVTDKCELLLEIAGFRHIEANQDTKIEVDMPVSFLIEEVNEFTKENAIRVMVGGIMRGYVNRGMIPTFLTWMSSNRVINAWVEKINGTPGRPAAYVYVEISAVKS